MKLGIWLNLKEQGNLQGSFRLADDLGKLGRPSRLLGFVFKFHVDLLVTSSSSSSSRASMPDLYLVLGIEVLSSTLVLILNCPIQIRLHSLHDTLTYKSTPILEAWFAGLSKAALPVSFSP